MARRPTKREVERWLEQRDEQSSEDFEVRITDRVVSSSWEPPTEDNDVPKGGTETTPMFPRRERRVGERVLRWTRARGRSDDRDRARAGVRVSTPWTAA